MASALRTPMHEPILDIVRQSKDKIDVLVEKICNKLKKGLVVGDEVNFTVDDKVMKGEVVEVIQRQTPVKINLITAHHEGSPSSDKENDFVSETIGSSSVIRYAVRINDKTVNAIPPYALSRCGSAPTADVIRKFVLSKSKYLEDGKGEEKTGRWNVKCTPKKRKATTSPAQNNTKKAKTSKTPVQKNTLDAFMKINKPTLKKSTPDKKTIISPPEKKTPQQSTTNKSTKKQTPTKSPAKSSTTKKNTPNKKTSGAKSVIDLSNSPASKKSPRQNSAGKTTPSVVDLSKTKTGAKTSGKKTSKAAAQKNKTTPKTKSPANKQSASTQSKSPSITTVIGKSKTDPTQHQLNSTPTDPKPFLACKVNVDLTQDRPTTLPDIGNTSTSVSVVVGTPDKESQDGSPMPVMMKETVMDHLGNTAIKFKSLGHLVSPVGNDGKNKTETKKTNSTNGMKQLTLFDLKMKSPDGSQDQFSECKPQTPKIARQLKQAMYDTSNSRTKSYMLMKAARELTLPQLDGLPSPIKQLVKDKAQLLQRKQQLSEMNDEEKNAFLKEKMRQRIETMKITHMKHEDTAILEAKPLPAADKVTLPGELSDQFDDVLFVASFLFTFQHYLIKPELPNFNQITYSSLADLLHTKNDQVHDILVSLLKTLLNDVTFSDAHELDVTLKDVVLNKNTLSNLIHLTLVQSSKKKDRSDHEKLELSKLAEKVQEVDCTNMSCLVLLECLKMLCLLLLDGQGIIDYQDECQNSQMKIQKRRHEALKELYDFEKEYGPSPTADPADSGRCTPILLDENGEPYPEPQTLNDVLRLRREMAKRSAEEREKRQIEEKKNKHIASRRSELEHTTSQLTKKMQECVHATSLCKRLSPIGTDRHHNRYWLLPAHRGIFVEKGWIGEEVKYQFTPKNGKTVRMDNDRTRQNIPLVTAHEWYHYKAEDEIIKSLMDALSQNGLRESLLHSQIKSNFTKIIAKPSKQAETEKKKAEETTSFCTIESFKEDLEDLENSIRTAGLGGITDYDKWTASLSGATTIDQLGECLMECLRGVPDKNRCKVFKVRKDKQKPTVDAATEEKNNQFILKRFGPDAKLSAKRVWQENVKSARTISRLYVLMEILDYCVTWDKSVDNLKCRICKRAGNDASLLLCDGCDLGFHTSCIRISEDEIPEGDWFCPSCKPAEERKSRNNRNLKELSESEDEDQSSDEEPEVCVICNSTSEEGVVLCDTCLSAYHISCHQPPLRAVPRFAWTCHTCRFGTKMKKKTNGKKLNSSVDSESQASTESNAQPDQPKKSTKGGVVPTTKSPRGRPARGAKSSPEREEPPAKKGATNKRSTRNSIQPDSDKEDESAASSTEEDMVVSPDVSPRVSKRGHGNPVVSVGKSANKSKDIEPPSKKASGRNAAATKKTDSSPALPAVSRRSPRAAKQVVVENGVDSESEQSEYNSESESDDEIELNMSQEQEKMAKILSPKKPRNAKRKSTESNLTRKVLNGKPGKGSPKVTMMNFVTKPEGAKKEENGGKPMGKPNLLKNLKAMWSKLWAHRASYPFEYPVDKEEVPDYYDVIKNPMDLTTIREKMESYETPEDFLADMKQMIFNSFDYNPADSTEVKVSKDFEDYFVKLLNRFLPGVEYQQQKLLFGYKN